MGAYRFSKSSEYQLSTIHPDLQRVIRRALGWGIVDFKVVIGHRGQAAQDEAFRTGASQKRWPDGNHNSYPSKAVDLAVLVNGEIQWKPRAAWDFLAGVMLAAAAVEGVRIRSGRDWDSDNDVTDQTFNDLGHFEL